MVMINMVRTFFRFSSMSLLLICGQFYIGYGQTTVDFISSNLPIVMIDTGGKVIRDDPRIVAHMGIITNPDGERNYLTDAPDDYNGRISIEIRGKSSQMFPKKSYGFETQDESSNNLNVSLLGMPQENDWILYAPYSDKSLLRNVICFDLTRKMGWYASRTQFCELLLNGEYQGIYVLMEKIKRDADRLNIARLNPDEVSGDDVTGGYIFAVDKMEGEYGGWYSSFDPPGSNWNTIFFQYYYPKFNRIVPEQETYIQNYLFAFEQTLNSTAFRDPETGYKKYINVASFIDHFIIYEFAKEIDSYKFSVYMHKDRNSRGGRLTAGPVWDFNLGFGNVDFGGEGAMFPEGWMYDKGVPRMYWWNRLMQDSDFRDRLKTRWVELRSGPFHTDSITNFINTQRAYTDEARQRNFQRWPVIGEYIWPNYYVGVSYQDEMNYLRDWIHERLVWMDANMPGEVTGSKRNAGTTGTSPVAFSVHPNPATISTTMRYNLNSSADVRIGVYDILGRMVRTLVKSQQAQGMHQVIWNGTDGSGRSLPNGIFFYSVIINGSPVARGKIILVR
jgi:hypothetical protein